jgi:hypothetical protein
MREVTDSAHDRFFCARACMLAALIDYALCGSPLRTKE